MRGMDGVLFSKVRLPSSHKHFCYVCAKLDCICKDDGDKTDSKDDSKAKQDVAEAVVDSTTENKVVAGPANNDDTTSSKEDVASNSSIVSYTTSWKRFAILPYQDRRKFTLGTRYTSWQDQGEFIFLNIKHIDDDYSDVDYSSYDDSSDGYSDQDDDKDDMKETAASIVEISCDSGQYYIMSAVGVKLVINGKKKRHNNGRYKLNFGDRLDISWKGENV
ncbi:uncharacterized protein LOC118439447 [Folsomia candida]|uniref:uncharacterized protein LOC118439447 n=1 Tax=Folsomia candida TaxID=158441 RepID=UPI001604B2FC|nr:uncharacterized protein LOC118439447 [Folsomia candida]